MSSITKKTKQGVQPLAADDGILADSTSDGESPGVSEGDGPLLFVRVDGCMRVRLSHFYGARNAMVDGR